MVQAQLQLPFTDVIRGLLHIAQLRTQIIRQTKADGSVGTISIKNLYHSSVADIAASVNEEFVV
jgi:hypothetical protein